MPDAKIHTKTFFTSAARDLKEMLYRSRSMQIFANKELKIYSRVGESEDDFRARCRAAADDAADEAQAKLRKTYDNKMDRVEAALSKAEDRLRELELDARSQQTDSIMDVAGDLLGSFLGGKRRARNLASKIGSSSSRRAKTQSRIRTAENRIGDALDDLDELEDELAAELNDITVDDIVLAWIPVE